MCVHRLIHALLKTSFILDSWQSPIGSQYKYDAVVIGAGWAGIRATETLLNAGITNLLVLEANNYVGGRAKSINEDGTINNANLEGAGGNIPYDIGCEWLYNTGNDMEETLLDKGYLDGAILDGDKDTAIPLSGMIFQQKRDKETGDLTTEVLEDKEAWVDEIWGGFLQFREERLDDDLKGLSYAGMRQLLLFCTSCDLLLHAAHICISFAIVHHAPLLYVVQRRGNRQLY